MAKVGKYELVRKLATGGMAEVFLAKAEWAMGVERIVVVKRILAHLVEESSFTEMFLSEAKLASQLSHPNIVQIFEFGESEGLPYLAMEYVDGPNLRSLATRAFEAGTPLPFRACAKIISSACEALAYAHELTDLETGAPLQIVHRDISPDNILISRNGAVKVVDFGIAKAVTQSHKTKTGMVKGKVAYMAPEQLKSKTIDRRADVYALGVVLYEMLSGVKPYDADSEITMIHAVLYEPIVPIRDRRPDVPEEVEAIINKALAHDRDVRYADCREMYTDLERYVMTSSHEPIGAFQIAQLLVDLKVTPAGPQGTPPPGMATPNRQAPAQRTPPPAKREEAPKAPAPAVEREPEEEVRTLMEGSEGGLTMRVLAEALMSDPDEATRPQKALNFQDRTRMERTSEPPRSKAHAVPAPAEEPKPSVRRSSGLHRAQPAPPSPAGEPRSAARGGSGLHRAQPAPPTPAGEPRPAARRGSGPHPARPAPPAREPDEDLTGPLERTPRLPPKRATSRLSLIATAIACLLLLGGSAVVAYQFWKPKHDTQNEADDGHGPTTVVADTASGTVIADAGPSTVIPDPGPGPARSDGDIEGPDDEPEQAVQPQMIHLTVQSEPAAFIRLTQRKRTRASGRSPLTAKLLPGTYDIEVSEEGEGISKTDRVVLKAGSDSVRHTVVIGKSTLIFNSVPWANVMLDAKALGETPVKKDVYEGIHTVHFVCSNGKKDTQQVTCKAGEEVRVKAKCQ